MSETLKPPLGTPPLYTLEGKQIEFFIVGAGRGFGHLRSVARDGFMVIERLNEHDEIVDHYYNTRHILWIRAAS